MFQHVSESYVYLIIKKIVNEFTCIGLKCKFFAVTSIHILDYELMPFIVFSFPQITSTFPSSSCAAEDWLKPAVILEVFEARSVRMAVSCAKNISKAQSPEEGYFHPSFLLNSRCLILLSFQ